MIHPIGKGGLDSHNGDGIAQINLTFSAGGFFYGLDHGVFGENFTNLDFLYRSNYGTQIPILHLTMDEFSSFKKLNLEEQ